MLREISFDGISQWNACIASYVVERVQWNACRGAHTLQGMQWNVHIGMDIVAHSWWNAHIGTQRVARFEMTERQADRQTGSQE